MNIPTPKEFAAIQARRLERERLETLARISPFIDALEEAMLEGHDYIEANTVPLLPAGRTMMIEILRKEGWDCNFNADRITVSPSKPRPKS